MRQIIADLNRAIPFKNLGELKWYGGCRYSRDRERGTLIRYPNRVTRKNWRRNSV